MPHQLKLNTSVLGGKEINYICLFDRHLLGIAHGDKLSADKSVATRAHAVRITLGSDAVHSLIFWGGGEVLGMDTGTSYRLIV